MGPLRRSQRLQPPCGQLGYGVPVGKSLAVVPIDVDRDGWMDFIVANDTTRNFLYRNLGDGTFEEVGSKFGVAYDDRGQATGAMGIDAAHYRNDDLMGIGIGNFANEMTSFYVGEEVLLRRGHPRGHRVPIAIALLWPVLLRLRPRWSARSLPDQWTPRRRSARSSRARSIVSQGSCSGMRGLIRHPASRSFHLKRWRPRHSDRGSWGSVWRHRFRWGSRSHRDQAGSSFLLRNDQQLGHRWIRIRLHDPARPMSMA